MIGKKRDLLQLPVCAKCKREIVCEACGKSTATRFGMGMISDDLAVVPRDLCDRCYRAWTIKPEDRIPSDAQAVAWAESNARNLPRYLAKSFPERKDGQ